MREAELKAKELFDIYNRVGLQQRDEAKECALICVGQITNRIKLLNPSKQSYYYMVEQSFWLKVKQILTDKY